MQHSSAPKQKQDSYDILPSVGTSSLGQIGETSDQAGIIIIQLTPGRMSNVITP
jgi:hypothetical protein